MKWDGAAKATSLSFVLKTTRFPSSKADQRAPNRRRDVFAMLFIRAAALSPDRSDGTDGTTIVRRTENEKR